jgi:hypothetical protein
MKIWNGKIKFKRMDGHTTFEIEILFLHFIKLKSCYPSFFLLFFYITLINTCIHPSTLNSSSVCYTKGQNYKY